MLASVAVASRATGLVELGAAQAPDGKSQIREGREPVLGRRDRVRGRLLRDSRGRDPRRVARGARLLDHLVSHAVEHVDYPFPRPYDTSEISDDPGSVRRDQTHGAVSAVTEQSTDPSSADVDNLKQVCRYAIFHATFFHTWTNDQQPDDAGEVVYASLGLRNGSMGEESDENVAPLPLEAAQQLYNVNALAQTVRGLILGNEFGDVRPEFIALLSKQKDAFARLGVDAARNPFPDQHLSPALRSSRGARAHGPRPLVM